MSEPAPQYQFRISSFCDMGTCVEVAGLDDGSVALRDSKVGGSPYIFTSREWDAFLAGVKAGEFDRSTLSS